MREICMLTSTYRWREMYLAHTAFLVSTQTRQREKLCTGTSCPNAWS